MQWKFCIREWSRTTIFWVLHFQGFWCAWYITTTAQMVTRNLTTTIVQYKFKAKVYLYLECKKTQRCSPAAIKIFLSLSRFHGVEVSLDVIRTHPQTSAQLIIGVIVIQHAGDCRIWTHHGTYKAVQLSLKFYLPFRIIFGTRNKF